MNLTKQFGIALTGGIACGKSEISNEIKRLGYLVIDADQVARQVVAPGTEGLHKLVRLFGQEILEEGGGINRPHVRQIIFNDRFARESIEKILHPLIHQRTLEILTEHNLNLQPKLWFYEAALIFEKQREHEFLEVWVAYCQRDTQVARLMKRDNYSLADAHKIIDAQMPTDKKAARADLVIDTDQSLASMFAFIQQQIKIRQRNKM